MKNFIFLVIFLLCDVFAYITVPQSIRHDNIWSLIPGCGYVLAIEYHFGNKLKR